jgi:hypothetical protein
MIFFFFPVVFVSVSNIFVVASSFMDWFQKKQTLLYKKKDNDLLPEHQSACRLYTE